MHNTECALALPEAAFGHVTSPLPTGEVVDEQGIRAKLLFHRENRSLLTFIFDAFMPSHVDPPSTALQRALQVTRLTICIARGLIRAILLWPRYRNIWPLSRLIVVSVLRLLSPLEEPRLINPAIPTGRSIHAWAREHGVQHLTNDIQVDSPSTDFRPIPDVTLHTIHLPIPQPPKATSDGPAIMYIHGGGFRSPLNPKAQLSSVHSLAKSLKCQSIYIPEYNLAPMHAYPTQPAQIYASLQYLISQGTTLDNLILVGDSAGGTLALSLLAHLIDPAPFYPPLHLPRHNRDARFAAVLLISPYIRFHQTENTLTPSWTTNALHDYLFHRSDLIFQRQYKGTCGEVWAEPGHTTVLPGFWGSIPASRVTVIAGEWEVMRDDIITFGQRLQADVEMSTPGTGEVRAEVEVVVAERAVHVESALDSASGHQDGSMWKVLYNWTEETLKR